MYILSSMVLDTYRLFWSKVFLFVLGLVAQAFKHTIGSAFIVNGSGNPGQQWAHGNVQVLYSKPRRDFDPIGRLSVRKYKPGFSDPIDPCFLS